MTLVAELVDPEGVIESEVAAGATRDDVAMTYALAMAGDPDSVDWPRVNRAIMDGWSRAGLVYVKTKAHKILQAKREEAIANGR